MPACPRCARRGKTWDGDDPKCAFPDGVFTGDNWNCATMNALRELASITSHTDDVTCAVLPYLDEACFLVLSWYKSRGATGYAKLVNEDGDRDLTLDEAEGVIQRIAGAIVAENEERMAQVQDLRDGGPRCARGGGRG